MKDEIYFVSSNDSRLKQRHIDQAVRIAEHAFRTKSDETQMEISEQTIAWTTKYIPQFWSLILIGDECVGGSAILPSTSKMMSWFLAGQIDEASLLKFAQSSFNDSQKFDCLYLAGITVREDLQGQGLGTKAIIHAIESARATQPGFSVLFAWLYSESGAKLIARLQASYSIHTRTLQAA